MMLNEPSAEELSRFESARVRVLSDEYSDCGIGSYSERALHKIIKLFIEPDESFHEVKHLGAVADIKRGEAIYEVQTRALVRLKSKLDKFLTDSRVTVVYPIAVNTRIFWLDRESGEISPPRKSPKHSDIFDSAFELYNIRDYITHPNFSLKLAFIEADEFRYRGGKVIGRERKKVRIERIPTSLLGVFDLKCPEDYCAYFPEGIGEEFTAADINRHIGGGFKCGYSIIRILLSAGVIEESGRRGRSIMYRLK